MQKIIYVYIVGCVVSGLVLIKDFYLSEEEEREEVREQLSAMPERYWSMILFLTTFLIILSSWYYVYQDVSSILFKRGGE